MFYDKGMIASLLPPTPPPTPKPSIAFADLWQHESIRHSFLSCLPKEDLPSIRLACSSFGHLAAPHLFSEIEVNFRASSFSKPARMAALERIGKHVQTLTFSMAHTTETFLPPLIDQETGEEVPFEYIPYCSTTGNSSTARLSVPTYGSWEMTDLLVKQYPPLFHAAANVPSFTRAFSAIPNLSQLRISCPGQDLPQRFRRSVVDYALISLRIAVERSPLSLLSNLSLLDVHSSALLYLNPTMGFGTNPASRRRWRQIHTLTMRMPSLPTWDNGVPIGACSINHLKHLHAFLQTFEPNLRSFTFHWLDSPRGPFPLALDAEPLLGQRSSPRLSCPKRCHLALKPLRFPKLRSMEVENVLLDAAMVARFITAHRKVICEFGFEDCGLRSGSWEEALIPLETMVDRSRKTSDAAAKRVSSEMRSRCRKASSERTLGRVGSNVSSKNGGMGSNSGNADDGHAKMAKAERAAGLSRISKEEVMDVPLLLSPLGLGEGVMDRVVRDLVEERRAFGEKAGGFRDIRPLARAKWEGRCRSPLLGLERSAAGSRGAGGGSGGWSNFFNGQYHLQKFFRGSPLSWR
ncbi:hypothetical protein MMC25_003299 [Agyrium rufum]|nr:hypothetical protein [Agyrium rufum]